jgi:hypothetical protein
MTPIENEIANGMVIAFLIASVMQMKVDELAERTSMELMDVPALCLVDGAQPGRELLEAAHRAGTAVMVSPSGLAKTVRTFEELLQP